LVDIRQALVQCDSNRNRILKEVDKVMSDIINVLKERKNEIIGIVDQVFKEEKDKIIVEDTKWRERQKICEELLKMSSKKDSDLEILSRSKYVAEGIDALNEKTKFNELKLISSIDTMLHHKDETTPVDISSHELV
jgi:hypothetical protein